MFGDRLHVWVDSGDPGVAKAAVSSATEAAGLTPSGLRSIVPSLEDVFIAKLAADLSTAARSAKVEGADQARTAESAETRI